VISASAEFQTKFRTLIDWSHLYSCAVWMVIEQFHNFYLAGQVNWRTVSWCCTGHCCVMSYQAGHLWLLQLRNVSKQWIVNGKLPSWPFVTSWSPTERNWEQVTVKFMLLAVATEHAVTDIGIYLEFALLWPAKLPPTFMLLALHQTRCVPHGCQSVIV